MQFWYQNACAGDCGWKNRASKSGLSLSSLGFLRVVSFSCAGYITLVLWNWDCCLCAVKPLARAASLTRMCTTHVAPHQPPKQRLFGDSDLNRFAFWRCVLALCMEASYLNGLKPWPIPLLKCLEHFIALLFLFTLIHVLVPSVISSALPIVSY